MILCTCVPYLLFELIHHVGEEDLGVVLVSDLAGAVEHPGHLVPPGQQGLHYREQLEQVTLGARLMDKHNVIAMTATQQKRVEGYYC